ncbi:mechanosensitive ion channel family protein [Stieleria sp. ICT_E10.1]|uniref:mechanosensitive ion channel family protein n=1 Tax=Stieleria sedimenti TaxID=2976331 RepID=UPI00217F6075|nr:mechanosensitive ion channel family protein [Stieleria sedimenti]MCS7470869.1 mechanosensitive ion channel family protein [Stieleria sedimenti]
MELLDQYLADASSILPLLGTIAVVLVGLVLVDRILKRRWEDNPDAQFRFQLIMLLLTFAGLLLIILALPVTVETRGQLLSLIGILLSAAIALSSATFIGNIMAGIMLKAVKSARPGDFITVADLTGRITEMGLLHTEVQTELRDLVTVPNLYMVTHPIRVVRASGTIIKSDISLGYDVPQQDVFRVLTEAATNAGLKDGFVQIRGLGDYSITYRVAGLLEDVKSLISSRSRLNEAALDALHAADIEIVSPSFMNTRPIPEDKRFIPQPTLKVVARQPGKTPSAEDVAFDKAEDAATVEELRTSIQLTDGEIIARKQEKTDAPGPSVEQLIARRERLLEKLKVAEEGLKD